MSPSTFRFSISIWNLVVRSLSCFPISCSPFSFGGPISIPDLSSDESSSGCIALLNTVRTWDVSVGIREFLQTKYLLWIFLMTGYQPK